MEHLGRHPQRGRLEIIVANLNRFADLKFPILDCCLSNTKLGSCNYVHHSRHQVHVKRFLFPGLDDDFENPDLFIFQNHAMMARISDNRVIRA